MKKIVLILVVVIALLVAGVIYCFNRPQTQSITHSPVDEKTTLANLQGNVRGVPPHFIDNNKGDGQAALTPNELRIRGDLVALFATRYASGSPSSQFNSALIGAENGIWLNAIGERYILLTQAEKFAVDLVLDMQTGHTIPLTDNPKVTKRYYLAPERSMALYIDPQSMHTYSLDQSTTTLVAGSRLSGTETYDNGYVGGIGIEINPEETHTKNSITISVFDSSKDVPNPDIPGATMYARVGQKTLSF